MVIPQKKLSLSFFLFILTKQEKSFPFSSLHSISMQPNIALVQKDYSECRKHKNKIKN